MRKEELRNEIKELVKRNNELNKVMRNGSIAGTQKWFDASNEKKEIEKRIELIELEISFLPLAKVKSEKTLQPMYYIYVNYKGDRNSSQVVDYISTQDGGKTFYHGLVEDRSNALMFTEQEINEAVKRAKADFGNSYTVRKEYAGYHLA